MYSNSYCSYKFAPKQEKIGQLSHKEYSNNILKYLEFTAIINACTKKVWKLIECTSYHDLESARWPVPHSDESSSFVHAAMFYSSESELGAQ